MCVCVKVYKERVLSVAVNCAKEAAKTKVDRFIHFSTAQVYDCDKVGYGGLCLNSFSSTGCRV